MMTEFVFFVVDYPCNSSINYVNETGDATKETLVFRYYFPSFSLFLSSSGVKVVVSLVD